MCERQFKSKINMTLHIYWHTVKGSYSDNDDTSDVDDPSQEMKVTVTMTMKRILINLLHLLDGLKILLDDMI